MKFKFISIFIIALSTVSCSSFLTDKMENSYDDYFFIENSGAKMPVWVRGNPDSKTFLIYVLGGPGAPSVPQILSFTGISAIESNFVSVYYDQRSCGVSQGNAQPETLSLAQFTEDLDIVVETIRQLYEPDKIFLLGYSWGGALTTAYLTNSIRHDKISGWIEVDGGHNLHAGFNLSVAWVTNYATEQVTAGNDPQGEWSAALEWYRDQDKTIEQNESLTTDFINRHTAYVNEANGYVLPENAPSYPFEIIFSPFSVFGYQANGNNLFDETPIQFLAWDFTPVMNHITLPTLILWGERDGIIPIPMATNAYQSLGTPVTDKHLTVISNAGHLVFEDNPAMVLEAITNFLKSY